MIDYKKKYDEVLAKAEEIHRNEVEKRFDMEWLFPELKESENEMIRKFLIEDIKDTLSSEDFKHYNPEHTKKLEEALAWLEKQSEKKHKFIIGDIISNNNVIYRVDNIVKNCIGQDCYFLVNVESENDGTRYLKLTNSEGKTRNSGEITWLCKQVDAKFEKQGEQKPIDKVEPKFHEGDWILYSGDHYEGVRHITKINENGYYIERNGLPHGIIPFNHEICMRLWTIQDAKDGDVLFHSDSASNGIFIFKEIIDRDFAKKIICYCDYDSEDHFCLGEHHTCCWADAEILHPATKKQCDFLFQKMKEAGYTFDFEKKEMKKIHVIDEGKPEMDYCFTKMMNSEKVSPAWSEEDERLCSCLIEDQKEALDDVCNDKYGHSEIISDLKEMYRERIDWLKSIKQRIGG